MKLKNYLKEHYQAGPAFTQGEIKILKQKFKNNVNMEMPSMAECGETEIDDPYSIWNITKEKYKKVTGKTVYRFSETYYKPTPQDWDENDWGDTTFEDYPGKEWSSEPFDGPEDINVLKKNLRRIE